MKKIERILLAALTLGFAGLLVNQLVAEEVATPYAGGKTPSKLDKREVIDINQGTMIMGSGRFETKLIKLIDDVVFN